jgi:hypothetical protein
MAPSDKAAAMGRLSAAKRTLLGWGPAANPTYGVGLKENTAGIMTRAVAQAAGSAEGTKPTSG